MTVVQRSLLLFSYIYMGSAGGGCSTASEVFLLMHVNQSYTEEESIS